jgi:hypothetical protein
MRVNSVVMQTLKPRATRKARRVVLTLVASAKDAEIDPETFGPDDALKLLNSMIRRVRTGPPPKPLERI